MVIHHLQVLGWSSKYVRLSGGSIIWKCREVKVRWFFVHANETLKLPCLIKTSPPSFFLKKTNMYLTNCWRFSKKLRGRQIWYFSAPLPWMWKLCSSKWEIFPQFFKELKKFPQKTNLRKPLPTAIWGWTTTGGATNIDHIPPIGEAIWGSYQENSDNQGVNPQKNLPWQPLGPLLKVKLLVGYM